MMIKLIDLASTHVLFECSALPFIVATEITIANLRGPSLLDTPYLTPQPTISPLLATAA